MAGVGRLVLVSRRSSWFDSSTLVSDGSAGSARATAYQCKSEEELKQKGIQGEVHTFRRTAFLNQLRAADGCHVAAANPPHESQGEVDHCMDTGQGVRGKKLYILSSSGSIAAEPPGGHGACPRTL